MCVCVRLVVARCGPLQVRTIVIKSIERFRRGGKKAVNAVRTLVALGSAVSMTSVAAVEAGAPETEAGTTKTATEGEEEKVDGAANEDEAGAGVGVGAASGSDANGGASVAADKSADDGGAGGTNVSSSSSSANQHPDDNVAVEEEEEEVVANTQDKPAGFELNDLLKAVELGDAARTREVLTQWCVRACVRACVCQPIRILCGLLAGASVYVCSMVSRLLTFLAFGGGRTC